ncbi:Asp-tRNA(Asn)/Glu-tRNA(Gln) amidotransferase GatCAB subunit A [Candidatus Falkowbacteria bacterium HGW-Falkowbacteria-2]|uniref:Glutamyl-tRNA(Gln) amidotransferase subunit A n=1 Tax=Candidatus Falkowbacteria bacterium HGW-Falkowbacteria-2 TaxID=2013769 RepID=A0A2N2E3P6_9BACT|nr:MAG: Asp-tRNA(Asn)/Glu-tRNA(Gln) amidotransferase GatCAB subunit A [Candidatus Falkowbacteria bacterium HGW-Falkowbacteria-2]
MFTIAQARRELDQGNVSAVELTRACLNRIKALDSKINSCLLIDEEGALAAAENADRRLRSGERGSLLGIPYLAKDLLMTKGLRTSAASKILENYIAPFDASVIVRLKDAGAVLLGKTNLDEFAHGSSTENSAFGPTLNPWDDKRVPGGSSGGSAAAVAAGLCLFALGTDTGGSIRQPASFCNLVGLKPTYGRVSRFGLLSMTSSTDTIGPLTRTVEDAAMVLSVISGNDKYDATTLKSEVPVYEEKIEKGIDGLRIGVVPAYFEGSLDPRIKETMLDTILNLKKAGAIITEIELPNNKYSVPVYYVITPSEVSSNLARFDGIGWGGTANGANDLQAFYKANRGQGFGPEAKRRIMLGTFALSAGYADAYYKKAQLVRENIKEDFKKAFSQVDIILTPTSPHPAFKIGAQSGDPLAMYLEDIYLAGASLAGLPAISVPAGFVNEERKDLPFGLQLIGASEREETVLYVARVVEKINNYFERQPVI